MMQGVNTSNDADDDAFADYEIPTLRSQDLKCPVCQAVHCPEPEHLDHHNENAENDENNGDAVRRRRVYPGAMLVYVQTKCPICWNEEAGPPIVALPCGHAICSDDYQRLGGRLPGHNNHDSTNHPQEDAPMNRSSMSSSGRMGRWRLERSDANLRSGIVMGTTNAQILRQEMMQHLNDESSADDSAYSSSDDDDDDEPYNTDEHNTSDSSAEEDGRQHTRMRPFIVSTGASQENNEDENSDVPPLVPRLGRRRLPSSEWTRHRDTEQNDDHEDYDDVCDVPPLVPRRSIMVQDDPLDHPDGWPHHHHGHAQDDSDDGSTSHSSNSHSILAVEDPPPLVWRSSGLRDPESSDNENICDNNRRRSLDHPGGWPHRFQNDSDE